MSFDVYFETDLGTEAIVKRCVSGFKKEFDKGTTNVAFVQRSLGNKDVFAEFDDIPLPIERFDRMHIIGTLEGYIVTITIIPEQHLVLSRLDDALIDSGETMVLKVLDILCSIIKPSVVYQGDEIPSMERVKAEREPNKILLPIDSEWRDYSAKVKAIVEKYKSHG